MPRTPVEYVPRPYVRPAYEPDTRTMLDLLRLSGASRANAEGQKGQNRAAGIFTLGKLISDALGGIQDERMQRNVLAQKQAESDRDESFRRDQLAELSKEREFNRQTREESAREKSKADAYRMGGDMAEAIEYGPVDESQVDPLMQGPAAGRVRYAFGPGTAEGPELQPSPSQQRGIQSQQAIEKMGGTIGPNGQVVMPPKAEKPAYMGTLEWAAANGDKMAQRAIEIRDRNRAPQPPQEQKFVIRNGQVVPITAGTAQPGDVPYSADAMQGMGGESADARSMRTAAALNSIDVLKELAPKRVEGPIGMVQGALESGKGALGYNTQVKQYNALLGPTAMQMAVALQGAAGLSNAEREVMKGMLGSISTMDYQSQMALLERASEMVRGNADVSLVDVKDPKTGIAKPRWVPQRSRMPGAVTVGQPGAVPPQALPSDTGGVSVTAPDGSVHSFATQAQADVFKKLIGGGK